MLRPVSQPTSGRNRRAALRPRGERGAQRLFVHTSSRRAKPAGAVGPVIFSDFGSLSLSLSLSLCPSPSPSRQTVTPSTASSPRPPERWLGFWPRRIFSELPLSFLSRSLSPRRPFHTLSLSLSLSLSVSVSVSVSLSSRTPSPKCSILKVTHRFVFDVAS
jgi:hypothetical protein